MRETQRPIRSSSPGRTRNGTPAGAFTLFELLVVIAIIALLAGMLLPALDRAKATALTAACRSNLQQLQKALLMYADDNADVLPAPESKPYPIPPVPTADSELACRVPGWWGIRDSTPMTSASDWAPCSPI